MARFATLKMCVNRLRKPRPVPGSIVASRPNNGEILTSAIHLRESAGQTTTLRHLHKISDLSQSEALKAIAELENSGLVNVSNNTHDAFESEVSLSQEMRDRIEAKSRRNAA